MATALKIMLVIALLTGGTTGTALAANESIPGGPLYGLDQQMEQVQVQLAARPQTQTQLQIKLAAERGDELARMALKGQPITEENLDALENHLASALKAAAQLDEPAMLSALNQIKTMTQEQAGHLEQNQVQAGAALMTKAQQQAQSGLDDPAGFQSRYRNGNGWDEDVVDPGDDEMLDEETPGNKPDDAGQNCVGGTDCDPDRSQNRDRNQEENCDDPTVDCDTGQEQEQNRERHNEDEVCDPDVEDCEDDTPGNGPGPGAGDGTCTDGDDCEPDQDRTRDRDGDHDGEPDQDRDRDGQTDDQEGDETPTPTPDSNDTPSGNGNGNGGSGQKGKDN